MTDHGVSHGHRDMCEARRTLVGDGRVAAPRTGPARTRPGAPVIVYPHLQQSVFLCGSTHLTGSVAYRLHDVANVANGKWYLSLDTRCQSLPTNAFGACAKTVNAERPVSCTRRTPCPTDVPRMSWPRRMLRNSAFAHVHVAAQITVRYKQSAVFGRQATDRVQFRLK
jgi:hypothetical protein